MFTAALDYFNVKRPLAGHCLAVCVGLLMPIGFAPFVYWVLPFISLFMLSALLRVTTARMAAIRGGLYGLGMFGLGVSWVYNSLHDFGAASIAVAGIIAAGLVVINALYIGLFGYIVWRLAKNQPRWLRILLFPAAWVFIEWLRSWVLTGFPWLLVGYSQVDSWLAGYAPVGGVLLVSFMVGLITILLFESCSQKGQSCYLFLVGVGVAVLLGVMLGKIEWTSVSGAAIQASLVQGNVPQEVKLKPENLSISLNQYTQLTEEHMDSDVIIWPETAIPAFRHRIVDSLLGLHEKLQQSGSELLAGIFVYDFDSRRYYNSVFKMGDEQAVYHKKHLVPFGEYMPLRGLLTFLNDYINIPMSDIDSGDSNTSITLAGQRVGVSICYESAYTDVYRDQLPEAAFLINVSNDAWFGKSLAPHQHLQIARMRALEASRYLLRATNTGISAIIDEHGYILRQGPQFQTHVLTGSIYPMRGVTLFILLGSLPIVIFVCLVLLYAEISLRRTVMLAAAKAT